MHHVSLVIRITNIDRSRVSEKFKEEILMMSKNICHIWISYTPLQRFHYLLLSFFFRTTCQVGYEGKLCDKKSCTPRDDDQGHYTCSKDNQIVCLPGWTDPNTGCIKSTLQN